MNNIPYEVLELIIENTLYNSLPSTFSTLRLVCCDFYRVINNLRTCITVSSNNLDQIAKTQFTTNFPNLKELTIKESIGNKNFTDQKTICSIVKPVASNLIKLSIQIAISQSALNELVQLGLTSLRTLSLSGSQIVSLQPLCKLLNLHSLSIGSELMNLDYNTILDLPSFKTIIMTPFPNGPSFTFDTLLLKSLQRNDVMNGFVSFVCKYNGQNIELKTVESSKENTSLPNSECRFLIVNIPSTNGKNITSTKSIDVVSGSGGGANKALYTWAPANADTFNKMQYLSTAGLVQSFLKVPSVFQIPDSVGLVY